MIQESELVQPRSIVNPLSSSLKQALRPEVVSIAGLLVFWWLLSLGQPTYVLPSPWEVLTSFWEMSVETGVLWRGLRLSMASLLLGGALALSVGIVLGLLMGAQQSIEEAFDLYVNGLYVAPVSALTPLLIFWFGIDLAPRVAAVFIFAAPEIIITTYQGARNTPASLVEVARAFGASKRDIFWKVIVPHDIPFIITAARLGLGRAIKGMVLAELVIGLTGIGELVDLYVHNFDTASLIAVLLTLMFMGVIGTGVVKRLEVSITPWRERE